MAISRSSNKRSAISRQAIPKNILAISHSSNPLGQPNVVGNQPRKDSSDLNDPPFSTHLIIQHGVNQWSAISRERI